MQNRKLSVQLKETEQVNVKTKRPGGFQTLPFRRMCFFEEKATRKKGVESSWTFLHRPQLLVCTSQPYKAK